MKVTLQSILGGVCLMDRTTAESYFPVVAAMIQNPLAKLPEKGDVSTVEIFPLFSKDNSAVAYPISMYGEVSPVSDAPKGSVAVISFDGAITANDQWCGDSGTKTKASLLGQCFANSNISGVVLKINSGGGFIDAISYMKNAMAAKNKPVYAVVESMAGSAAYWIASMADKVYLQSDMDAVGSIGAYTTIVDYTRYYENLGIKVTEIYSSLSSEKNEAYRAAMKGDTKPMEKKLDAMVQNFFIRDVKATRTQVKEEALKGAVYYANEAIEMGLADGIKTLQEACEEIATNANKGGFYV